MAGPGQGHIKHAQVLGQPFLIRSIKVFGCRVYHHPDCSVRVMNFYYGRILCGHLSETADKRQEHQGIFQALGFVDGHHPDQGLIAFQAEDLIIPTCLWIFNLRGQPPDQSLFSVLVCCSCLEQFRQMEHIGEPPFPERVCQHPGCHIECQKQCPDHGQNAPVVPDLLKLPEPLQHFLPGRFILVEPVQGGKREIQHRCGQGRPDPGIV